MINFIGYVIRLLLISLLLFSFTVSSDAQTVTINRTKVPLSIVIEDLRAQTSYVIVLAADVPVQKHVTIQHRNVDFREVLVDLGKQLNIAYTINDKDKAILLKSNVAKEKNQDYIVGQVVDSTGAALVAASVRIKDTKNMVLTDHAGVFTLKANVGDILVISYTGFHEFDMKLTTLHDLGPIVLMASESKLDEIQVIGYGTETRRFAVGAVTKVESKDLENQPAINVLDALAGLVPGLHINSTSGAPGSAVKVQIRGQNSLSQNVFGAKPLDQPLFIVNGVPVAAQNFNVNAFQSLGGSDYLDAYGGTSPFNGINPADIESISVLRDAAATAIYGTQGANGVILITTKKGKAGKTKLSATLNSGFNSPTRRAKFLNLEQYLMYRNEALVNDGIDLSEASPTDYPDLLLFDQNRNTDWFRHYLGRTAKNTDAHVNLSGGSDRTTFHLSTGYTYADYNIPGDFAYNRGTLHSNIRHTTADDRLTLDFGFDYAYEHNFSSSDPFATVGIRTPPNFPDMVDASGQLIWEYQGFNIGDYSEYAANQFKHNVLKLYNMTNSLAVSYRLWDHLKLDVNLGYSRIQTDENQKLPASTLNPINNPVSTSSFANKTFETINMEPQLNYQDNFGKGVFKALLGGTYRQNNATSLQLVGTNYSDEALMGSIGSAGTVQATDSYNPYKYAGAFARVDYVHNEKYILQVAGRRDGSSNFGVGRQFGNFGSIAAGWILSEEGFFKQAKEFISYAKLSGSYGTTGSDATLPYQYQQLFRPDGYVPDFQGIIPIFVQNLYNPAYSWDTKKALNVGLDLGMANDRLLFNVTYYHDRIGNQLINYTLPSQTGFSSVLQNFNATIQNQGLEISINAQNITKENFSWRTDFNISGNRNKLISFPGLEHSSYALLYTLGRSVDIVKGYVLKGVNPDDGIFEFYKTDGSVTYEPVYGIPSQGGDMHDIANLEPRFIGGLGNTFTYKNVSLSFLFQFQKKQQANYLKHIYEGVKPGGFVNQPVAVLGRWQQPGDISDIQRFTSDYGDVNFAGYSFTQSSGAYSDGSYIRLRTMAFSYMLPLSWCAKLGVENVRFFVNGQNLFLLTGYQVGDPELSNLFSFPIQRTIALGIHINL